MSVLADSAMSLSSPVLMRADLLNACTTGTRLVTALAVDFDQ
jgi:hypothetical protein